MQEQRPLGIFLTAAEAQSEGVDRVLDTVASTGAAAVSITPGVFARATPGDGVREPPLDVEAQVRLLDRPLWGQREIYLKGYLPYASDARRWAETGYPPPPIAPPELRIDVPRQVIDGARTRGMAVDVQITPFALPGAPGGQAVSSGHGGGRADDRPRRIDGSVPTRFVAGVGCPNNPRVQSLARARIHEVLTHYGDVDGVFLDWPEYPCYFLEDCFTCFCPHCHTVAEAAGYDWERIERDTRALWVQLHHLTGHDLERVADPADWPSIVADTLLRYPGVGDLLRFKAETIVQVLADMRREMDDSGGRSIALKVNGFPPPWCFATGMDYRRVGHIVQETRCKLFTFHWPMITRWWGESLLTWNPVLDPQVVLRALTAVLDLPAPASEHRRLLTDYGVPRPDEPHPIAPQALTRKLDQAVAIAEGGAACLAYLHSYRPVGEFAQVIAAARESTAVGFWVQRYGYLSDAKLAILQSVWH